MPPETTAPPRTTTTASTAPTSTFVPPEGVTATSVVSAEDVLDADTGRLPLFVGLSLGGFTVAISMVTVQWVRSRPRGRR